MWHPRFHTCWSGKLLYYPTFPTRIQKSRSTQVQDYIALHTLLHDRHRITTINRHDWHAENDNISALSHLFCLTYNLLNLNMWFGEKYHVDIFSRAVLNNGVRTYVMWGCVLQADLWAVWQRGGVRLRGGQGRHHLGARRSARQPGGDQPDLHRRWGNKCFAIIKKANKLSLLRLYLLNDVIKC